MKRLRYAKHWLLAVTTAGLLSSPGLLAAQATGQVSGLVTSETGQPLSGASVSVVGTASGTLTGADGRYTISGVQPGQRTVRAGMIGYGEQTATVTVAAGQAANQNFTLTAEALELEGIVAVGYGSQRRVNLTGAVSSVSAEQLEARPIARVTEALAGTTPGLTVIQRSSQPGEQDIQFNIRGRGSISNSTTPLILIDGIEGDINQLNPLDIASMSVLKDASSAAIYGSRAANGVILITTKRGQASGDLRISYDGYYGIQGIGTAPKAVGPRDYLTLINQARVNAGQAPNFYSEEYISNTEKALRGDPSVDPTLYPWTDWVDVLFDPAPIMDHTVGISGGSDLARFNLSLNYFDQSGMVANTGADRYGLRLNTDFTITEKLTAGADLSLRRNSYMESNNQGDVYFRLFHDTPPTVMAQYPDGTYGWSRNGHNPLAYAREWGTVERTTLNGIVRGTANYEIIDGLAIRTMASANVQSFNHDDWRNELQFRDYFTGNVVKSVNTNRLDRRKSNEAEYYLQGMIDYNRMFGAHAVTAMLGYDQTQHDEDEIRADREIFYNNQLQEINAGDASRDNNFGDSEAWRLRSGFGRLSYGYDDRYLFEANARYDGSSRFAEGNRFGFFPAFSAAWRISQERFFNVPWISELKIRGSWGEMGNQNIGLYRYFGSVALGQNYLFGETLTNGAARTTLANREISWETTEMTDIGLDLELFDNRLSFTGDIYRKLTTGNLISLPIPDIIGLGAPTQNAGSIENRGWEAAINWRDTFRDGNYALGFNVSDNKNKVLDLQGTGPFIDGIFIRDEGLPLGTIWAYEADGLFANEAEIAAHATQNPNTKPGDIRFVDQNSDGIINADDRTIVGNDLPRYTVGSNLSASWKGIDASMFFQGVLKAEAYLEGAMIEGPVWENFTTEAWLDHWTPENLNASMPRPALQVHHNFGERNSWWVQDASYVKLRNAQIGYTLPLSVTDRLNVDRMRIYVSGQNLLTFSAQDLLIDPEFPSGRGVTVHPQTRTISFGTSVGF